MFPHVLNVDKMTLSEAVDILAKLGRVGNLKDSQRMFPWGAQSGQSRKKTFQMREEKRKKIVDVSVDENKIYLNTILRIIKVNEKQQKIQKDVLEIFLFPQ